MAQEVKDLALSLPRLGSLLWHGFDSWSGTFCMLLTWSKKKKKKKKKANIFHMPAKSFVKIGSTTLRSQNCGS